MGRTRLAAEVGQFDSSIGTGLLFPDIEKELVWQKLARSGKNVIDVIPGTNIVIDSYSRSDFKKFRHGMTVLDDGLHGWAATETFGEVRQTTIGDEAQIFDVEDLRSSLQELSHQHLSVLRASVKQEQLVSVISKAEANLNLMDSSLLVTAAVLSVLPKVCRKKEIQVGLSVILVGSFLLVACNEALTSPAPAVKIATGTPTRIYPTETPEPTFVPISTPIPEIAITPSGGRGGAEFKPGTIQDLQASIDLGSFSPAKCVSADIDSSAYKSERAKLGPEANVELLRNELLKKIDPEQGQVLESLCVQGSWLFKALDKDKNIMWSWNQVKKNWADHPDGVLAGGWEFRSIKVRPGYKADFSIDRFGQPWLVELTKDGAPVRYFDTVSGTFLYFDFKTLFGSEKLINSSGWDAAAGAKVSNGILEVSGGRGDWNMVSNLETKLGNITGPFSVRTEFVIKDGGTDGGLVLIDRSQRGLKNWWDLRRLDFTVNLKPGGQSGLWIGYTNLSKDQIGLKYENSIPILANGKNIIDVKFMTDTKQMVVTINGRELRPMAIPDGFLDNNTIIPGFSAGPNTKVNISELSVRTPGGGQDNIRLLNVATATPTTVVTTPLPIVTTAPQFTPLPTFTKTPEPSKGPRLLTYNEGQNLLSNLSLLSECLAPARLGDLPDSTIDGWKYIRKGIKSVVGTVVNYPDGQSFDVKGAKRTVLYVFSNPPGGQEIIHMTNISPALVLPYLSSGDYVGVTVSPKGEIDGIYLLCYYR